MKGKTKGQLKSEIKALEMQNQHLTSQVNLYARDGIKEIERLRADIGKLTADNDKMRQQVRDYRGAIISLIDHYTGEINRMMEPEVNNNEF